MDRFLIAPYDNESGLQTDVKPFLIPDSAFAQLNNAYVWRGRVRKRFGSTWIGNTQLSSRFRIKLSGTTDGFGNYVGTVPIDSTTKPLTAPALGQMFSIGTEVFTVYQLGVNVAMYRSGTSTLATIDTTNAIGGGTVIINGAEHNADVYYYPSLPVMGLQTFEGAALNYEPVIGFDTKFAYQYLVNGWERIDTELMPGDSLWNGTDSQFFWTCTWLGTDASTKIFFVTNFNQFEPASMRYYDNVRWHRFLPSIYANTTPNVAGYLFGARILVPFKNRLLAFNTWEGATFPGVNYPNRCRYSQIGETIPPAPTIVGVTNNVGNATGVIAGFPFKPGSMFVIGDETFMITDTAGGAKVMPSTTNTATLHTFDQTTGTYDFANAAHNANIYWYTIAGSPNSTINTEWRQDIPGHGNALDCPTTEQIVTVEFIKDRLIVFFERSTWELVYKGNQAYPFDWQQINTELGAEATFSTVPFDKVAISVGGYGVIACNGGNVERIDQKIPSTVFSIQKDGNGPHRVYGIRDYTTEMLYWTFPDNTRDAVNVYPNKILVFNYKTGTWALNDDSITCFGYYYPAAPITWDSDQITWDMPIPWDSGSLGAHSTTIIAGNQQGYTFIINPDCTVNAQALQITDITTAPFQATITSYNHNFKDGDYVYINNVVTTALGDLDELNDHIFYIQSATKDTFVIDTTPLAYPVLLGGYCGNGTISRVSNISILTKEYNFYLEKATNAYVSKIDFLVETTAYGKIDIDCYVSTNQSSISSTSPSGVLISSGTLETSPYALVPLEGLSTRVWHPMYVYGDGECVQLQLYLDDEQMRDTNVRSSDFALYAMVFHAMPSSTRLE